MTEVHASRPPLQVVDEEYELMADVVCGASEESEAISLLWRELQRAEIVSPHDAPPDLVRMGSAVLFSDIATGELHYARVIYPGEDSAPGQVAISSSLGAALIGLRPGSIFRWRRAARRASAVRVEWVEAPPRLRPRRRAS